MCHYNEQEQNIFSLSGKTRKETVEMHLYILLQNNNNDKKREQF